MKNILKRILQQTPYFFTIRNSINANKIKKKLIEWEKNGKPIPPPHDVKRHVLQTYTKRFGLKILVETGTFYGDMVNAQWGHFEHIYSIELSKELFNRAKIRFEGLKNIEIICGDSAVELGNIIEKIDRPSLFWLDGHYSAGETAKGDKSTPIFEELDHILSAPDLGHVIIIDDARCFGIDPEYPTLEDLKNFIFKKRPGMEITVQDDSIRVTPLKT